MTLGGRKRLTKRRKKIQEAGEWEGGKLKGEVLMDSDGYEPSSALYKFPEKALSGLVRELWRAGGHWGNLRGRPEGQPAQRPPCGIG